MIQNQTEAIFRSSNEKEETGSQDSSSRDRNSSFDEKTKNSIFIPVNYSLDFPLKNIQILFPSPKNETIFSHMTFTINFLWNNQELQVERSFVNFIFFRSVLRQHLPFSLIFPIPCNTFKTKQNDFLLANQTEEINSFFNNLSAGGKINHPLQQTFWGATFGDITDKFEIHWMFNYAKK